MEDLVVEPNPDNELATSLKGDGEYVRVPYENVIAVGDYVLIEKRNLH